MPFGIPFERDRYAGLIELSSTNNAFVIDRGSGEEIKTIPAGEYWAYLSSGHELEASYPGFYDAFLVALASTGASVQAGTPTRSPFLYGGLRLAHPADTSITFVTTSVNWTLDPTLLGIPVGEDVASRSGALWVSPFCRGGEWLTHKWALDKDSDKQHEQYSTGRQASYRWESKITRRILYSRMPAALVRTSRAGEHQAYADAALLALGDTHNNFERLWDSTLSKEREVLIFHNSADTASLGAGEEWEVAQLALENQRDLLSACFSARQRRFEKYDLDLTFESLSRGYARL